MQTMKNLDVRVSYARQTIRRIILLILGTVYMIWGCYLYEQIFCELFIGGMQSFYRYYELIFIILSFFVFNLCPLLVVYYPKYRGYVRTAFFLNSGIPIIFIFIISLSNLSLYLGIPLQVQSKVCKADVIIIIDAGNFYNRSLYGAKLYHGGYANRIVVFTPITDHFLNYLEDELNIPHEAIIWAREAQIINTHIEALATKKLFNLYAWNRAIVISDSFHMYRVMKALRHADVQNVYFAPVSDDFLRISPARLLGWKYKELWDVPLYDLDFFVRLKFRHTLTIRILHEYVGICFYLLKGYI